MPDLTKAERDGLLNKAWALDRQLYPGDGQDALQGHEAAVIRENYYRILAEYGDRLPRVVMSLCPFTGEPLKRSFDPWGVDGPWWYQDREVPIEDPKAPPTFKVLLGALSFHGRTPVESRASVIPGPEVPFVVPRLLRLPGMVAIISRQDLHTGDTAYPVAYFSPQEIGPNDLHQFWLQQELWFELPDGESGWLSANDTWDFDLDPWIKSGKLRWLSPGKSNGPVMGGTSDGVCPYINLPGDRFPQTVAFGKRALLDLPDGTPLNPFEE